MPIVIADGGGGGVAGVSSFNARTGASTFTLAGVVLFMDREG